MVSLGVDLGLQVTHIEVNYLFGIMFGIVITVSFAFWTHTAEKTDRGAPEMLDLM